MNRPRHLGTRLVVRKTKSCHLPAPKIKQNPIKYWNCELATQRQYRISVYVSAHREKDDLLPPKAIAELQETQDVEPARRARRVYKHNHY